MKGFASPVFGIPSIVVDVFGAFGDRAKTESSSLIIVHTNLKRLLISTDELIK